MILRVRSSIAEYAGLDVVYSVVGFRSDDEVVANMVAVTLAMLCAVGGTLCYQFASARLAVVALRFGIAPGEMMRAAAAWTATSLRRRRARWWARRPRRWLWASAGSSRLTSDAFRTCGLLQGPAATMGHAAQSLRMRDATRDSGAVGGAFEPRVSPMELRTRPRAKPRPRLPTGPPPLCRRPPTGKK